jgi:hypothetical protein
MVSQGLSSQPEAPEEACTGKLFWIWGAYAFGMLWMSRAMGETGIPPLVIWAVAGAIGLAIAVCMREL